MIDKQTEAGQVLLPGHAPLVVATRGDGVEAVYYGSIAVMDQAGRPVAGVGDTLFPVFTRSTLKPFQALPFMADGGPAHFGFSSVEVALLCASHSGEPRHVAAVAGLLGRVGCSEQQLRCGSHVPLYYAATCTEVPAGLPVGPLHHNCSGKHAGFLAWCRQHGAPLDSYLEPDHPLQRAIRRHLAAFAECAEDEIPMGIDGCGAPNYALPLARLAQAYARLAAGKGDGPYGKELAALFAAMTKHPEMVSGEGRGDLALMGAAPGDWVAKVGADGVQALGIRSRGLGIAIKIADGNPRALLAAASAALRQLALLPGTQNQAIAAWEQGEIRNAAGRLTGRMMPVFDLR